MENVTNLVFENRDTLYKKVIDLYTTLLTIKIVDVVDDITNIKQDIEFEVIDSSILEKPAYYVDNLKIRLQSVYNNFGIVIDSECSLDGYILIAELVNKLEYLELESLDFLDYILTSDDQVEDKFIKLLDELYPLSNNVQYLEYIDVSEYLFENIVKTIYENKVLSETVVNTNMVNTMVKALSLDNKVKDTIVFNNVVNGEFNIELSIDKDTDLVIKQIKEIIDLLTIDEVDSEYLAINIFIMLFLYKDESELSYYILNTELSEYIGKLENSNYIKDMLNTYIQKVEV